MSDGVDSDSRLVEIESLLAHLQHDIEQLNATLTRYFDRFQEIDRRFERLERQLETHSQPEEHRDPDSERPPHW